MTLKVLFISLTGILVVFGFLFLLYLILSSFKYFFYSSETEVSDQVDLYKNNKEKPNLKIDEKLSGEEIAVVLTALSHHHNQNLQGDQITITKRR